jgi:hypothetical protein
VIDAGTQEKDAAAEALHGTTLLTAWVAGKTLDGGTIDAMKKAGLGTLTTRAAIIEAVEARVHRARANLEPPIWACG